MRCSFFFFFGCRFDRAVVLRRSTVGGVGVAVVGAGDRGDDNFSYFGQIMI